MNTQIMIQRLQAIRDAYARIHAVSADVDNQADNASLMAAVGQRSELFMSIAEQESRLDAECAGWRNATASGSAAAILREIGNLVRSVLERDAVLMKMFRERIAMIRDELSQLPSMARATAAYAGHAGFAGNRSSYR